MTSYDIGATVLCDLCNGDFTKSTRTGGFLFGSKAVCPDCAPAFEKSVREYGEEHYIRGRCPDGKSFADWCRDDLRMGNNMVTIIPLGI